VLAETRKKQAETMREITWNGKVVPVRVDKVSNRSTTINELSFMTKHVIRNFRYENTFCARKNICMKWRRQIQSRLKRSGMTKCSTVTTTRSMRLAMN